MATRSWQFEAFGKKGGKEGATPPTAPSSQVNLESPLVLAVTPIQCPGCQHILNISRFTTLVTCDNCRRVIIIKEGKVEEKGL